MGLFTRDEEINPYEKIKSNFKAKDGNIHLIMIRCDTKMPNSGLNCNTVYTAQMDYILDSMQKDEYEIIDIKFNYNGINGFNEGFYTLITYK